MYPRIRDLREDSERKQREIAELLGMSQTGYSKYETGENDIPVGILIKLADLYQTSTDYLLGRTDQREPYPPKK
nr:helix-turn-helix transcriptional regulator [uncultured Oscillibacter sp.]